MARDLAARHGVDPGPVDLAVASHDLARAMKGDALLLEARRCKLEVGPVEERVPTLLHGAVAAAWLERNGGVSDRRVLEAVHWHSTGKAGMGSIEKVVFLADKLDPDKVKRDPRLERVERLAQDSLDGALLEFLDLQLKSLVSRGSLIHSGSIELRNELLAARPCKG